MKRVLFALMVVSMLTATIAIAQNRSSNGRNLQKTNLSEGLNLSPTQEAELAEIYNNHQESMRVAKEGLIGDQLQAKRIELCKQRDSKVEQILDKEQFDKFLELCQMNQNSSL